MRWSRPCCAYKAGSHAHSDERRGSELLDAAFHAKNTFGGAPHHRLPAANIVEHPVRSIAIGKRNSLLAGDNAAQKHGGSSLR